MFYTHPVAERILPTGLAPAGERSWHWVELGLQIPYFFVSFTAGVDECELGRNFIFSQLRDVMGLIATSSDGINRLEIGLLSPGYMNGGSSYQLGQVKEIWRRRGGHEQMFVMADGTKLNFPPAEDIPMDQDMEMVVSL